MCANCDKINTSLDNGIARLNEALEHDLYVRAPVHTMMMIDKISDLLVTLSDFTLKPDMDTKVVTITNKIDMIMNLSPDELPDDYTIDVEHQVLSEIFK